ncbi:hypothetical protein BV20DRAFT_960867 [Pilatotrama ljubarskyi]|nr:hypothetical protein BV20DRAFT_960867 [Pilatotrama ljubarskyi]
MTEPPLLAPLLALSPSSLPLIFPLVLSLSRRAMTLQKRKRLPPHFSLDPETGDVLATDPTNHRVHRFARDQVRLILGLDETLRTGGFDVTRDVVPGGYSTFQRLWDLDASNACGLLQLPSEGSGPVSVTRAQIPTHLVLPPRDDDGARNARKFRQMQAMVADAYLNERAKREYHISKRLGNKAKRSALAAHAAATSGLLPFSRASSVLGDATTDFGEPHSDPHPALLDLFNPPLSGTNTGTPNLEVDTHSQTETATASVFPSSAVTSGSETSVQTGRASSSTHANESVTSSATATTASAPPTGASSTVNQSAVTTTTSASVAIADAPSTGPSESSGPAGDHDVSMGEELVDYEGE